MTEPKRTYFGLEILELGWCRVVRKADIQQLPFYDFWMDSAIGSTYLAGKYCQRTDHASPVELTKGGTELDQHR